MFGTETKCRDGTAKCADVPEGRHENSPAIYRWERDPPVEPSPVGTTEEQLALSAVPTGLVYEGPQLFPSDKSLGYFRLPLRGTVRRASCVRREGWWVEPALHDYVIHVRAAPGHATRRWVACRWVACSALGEHVALGKTCPRCARTCHPRSRRPVVPMSLPGVNGE